MPVALYQLAGLAGAALVHSLLVGTAYRVSRLHWVFSYYLAVLVLGSVLSWQALMALPWLVPVCGLVLLGAGGPGLWQIWRRWRGQAHAETSSTPVPMYLRWAASLAWLFLGIDLLWAAFPAYRYDQWSYHLIIPKIIAAVGPLPQPVFYDHVYFTGVYEYLFTIPRYVWANDTFNICYADAFTWLAYAIGLFGLIDFARLRLGWRWPAPVVLTAAILFAVPSHESLTNAKPDLLLTPMALAVLLLVEVQIRNPSRRNSYWLGLILALPLAVKVIWLHFLAALGLPLGVAWVLRKFKIDLPAAAAGVATALVVAAPGLIKNTLFFRNPLHPVQIWIFRSTPWVAASEAHWRVDTGRATSLAHYLAILAAIPQQFFLLGYWFLPVLLWFAWLRLRPKTMVKTAGLDIRARGIFAAALVVFLVIWPVFFDPRHMPRYMDAVFALPALAVIAVAARLGPTPVTVLALLLPTLGNSAMEVRVPRLVRGMGESLVEFYAKGTSPLDLHELTRTINEHRTTHFPGSTIGEHLTLADTPALYFLDSLNQRVNQADWDILYAEHIAGGGAPCLWAFLEARHINYVMNYELELREWPQALQPLITSDQTIADGEPLGNRGHVYYLPSEAIKAHAVSDPACRRP